MIDRLVVVTELDIRVDEGMAAAVRGLTDAARELELEVAVLSPPGGAGELRQRAAVALVGRKLRHSPSTAVVLYVPRGGLTLASVLKGELLARLARRHTLQLILQSDARPPRRLSRRVTYLVLTDALATWISDRGFRAVRIRLGVDASRFAAAGPADASMWPAGGRARILHVGHLKRERNLGLLAALSRRGFSCLLVASPSTEADPGLQRELEREGVRVVRRHVEDLPAIYRAADVYVFPVSDPRASTTMPISVLEALASGTPVVASRFGAIAEALGGVSGVRFASPDTLLDEVERLAVSPEAVEPDVVPAWTHSLHEVLRAAERRRPTSRLVLLLGLDGTGKSTQSRLLVAAARERGLRAEQVWARWDPLIMAPLLRLRPHARGESAQFEGDDYIAWKRRMFSSAFVRGIWRRAAAADHFLRVGLTLRRAVKRNDLVVCDRYYHDALVDMAVSFGSDLPSPVGMHRLFPEPDLGLVLDADEDTLVARTEGHSSKRYLKARRPLYLQLARSKGWPVIDATQPTAAVHSVLSRNVFGTP